MNSQAINYYINWALYAIYGKTQVADELMRRYRNDIYSVAQTLKAKHIITNNNLYRGVLIEPEQIVNGLIAPQNGIESISFSEDRDVACWFADTNSIISEYVKQIRPSVCGYITEYIPRLDDILFHYSWRNVRIANMFSLLDAAKMHPDIDVAQFAFNIETQKEVITKQVSVSLPVTLYTSQNTDELNKRFTHPFFR